MAGRLTEEGASQQAHHWQLLDLALEPTNHRNAGCYADTIPVMGGGAGLCMDTVVGQRRQSSAHACMYAHADGSLDVCNVVVVLLLLLLPVPGVQPTPVRLLLLLGVPGQDELMVWLQGHSHFVAWCWPVWAAMNVYVFYQLDIRPGIASLQTSVFLCNSLPNPLGGSGCVEVQGWPNKPIVQHRDI